MGNNPIPIRPIRRRANMDEERIYAMREAYARGSISLDFFENYVAEVFQGRIDSTNDFQLFPPFPDPSLMREITA